MNFLVFVIGSWDETLHIINSSKDEKWLPGNVGCFTKASSAAPHFTLQPTENTCKTLTSWRLRVTQGDMTTQRSSSAKQNWPCTYDEVKATVWIQMEGKWEYFRQKGFRHGDTVAFFSSHTSATCTSTLLTWSQVLEIYSGHVCTRTYPCSCTQVCLDTRGWC